MSNTQLKSIKQKYIIPIILNLISILIWIGCIVLALTLNKNISLAAKVCLVLINSTVVILDLIQLVRYIKDLKHALKEIKLTKKD